MRLNPFLKPKRDLLHRVLSVAFFACLIPNSIINPLFIKDEIALESANASAVIYEWGLYRWEDNQLECLFRTYSNTEPTEEDIQIACGKEISSRYKNTRMCYPYTDNNTKTCHGLYLHQAGVFEVDSLRTSETTITPLYAEVSNCTRGELCDEQPLLMIFSPYPDLQSDEKITLEKIFIDDDELEQSCDPPDCVFKIPVTGDSVESLEYWGEYSNEALTDKREVVFRNIYNTDEKKYELDIIDDRWKNNFFACEYEWEVFPVSNNPRSVLYEMPGTAMELHTEVKYTLLAGRLIWMGIVDASECPDGGLTENLAASPCGVEKAFSKVISVQNNFNHQILEAGLNNHIPPRVIKGLIGQESQFWRESVNKDEYGFGHITEMGMDQVLMWNQAYFRDLCLLHLDEKQCEMGYAQLGDYHQNYLIGQSIRKIGTSQEIDLIAKTLKAGCNQTYQIIHNLTKKEPREVLSYEDMWRINLGIYTAGAGCIGDAIEDAWKKNREDFTWENIAKYLGESCQHADGYFDRVESYGIGVVRTKPQKNLVNLISY